MINKTSLKTINVTVQLKYQHNLLFPVDLKARMYSSCLSPKCRSIQKDKTFQNHFAKKRYILSFIPQTSEGLQTCK